MTLDEFFDKLSWFYTLETNQVSLYTEQGKAFKGTYAGKVFERIAQIEQGHVDNIRAIFTNAGRKPSMLPGDIVASVLGMTAGKLLSLTGLDMVLKANTMLEKKAMSDYARMIHDVRAAGIHHLPQFKAIPTAGGVMSLTEILKNNYIDEDLHTAWFIMH